MPLHPTKYAEMLSKKMQEAGVTVWLVNTGWTGGPYGVGTRMKLKYTRAMITAAIDGSLEKANADKLNRLEGIKIPENFDYTKLKSLSYEALEKLRTVKPVTVSQASRISGVSPNDISVLMVYMGR